MCVNVKALISWPSNIPKNMMGHATGKIVPYKYTLNLEIKIYNSLHIYCIVKLPKY